MKKRLVIILISVFIILVVTVTAYTIWKGKNETVGNKQWIEKTINKEIMKTDADCGIASVKMLLGFYGIDVTYKELGHKINTTTEGTDWKDIKNYFKTLDKVDLIEFKENLDKAGEYLEKGYPLFICWNVDEEKEYSHYSILIAIDKYSVWMLDPAERKTLSEYSLDYFLPCWKSADYWFCILEDKDKINEKQEQKTDEKTTVKPEDPEIQVKPDSLTDILSTLDTNETDGN
jgi:ABC-type bacteriocin/lantibiotic exporter with double-glycine peptidase domain